MSAWEASGKSDEWYTPKYIFDALGCGFDCDVAAAPVRYQTHVPATSGIMSNSLSADWSKEGFIWMNPPFGGRNGIIPWLDKFFDHGNGIALTPDRTSTEWWHDAALRADVILFIKGKVKFERPDGTVGKQPSNGTTLFASGKKGTAALRRAASTLGVLLS